MRNDPRLMLPHPERDDAETVAQFVSAPVLLPATTPGSTESLLRALIVIAQRLQRQQMVQSEEQREQAA